MGNVQVGKEHASGQSVGSRDLLQLIVQRTCALHGGGECDGEAGDEYSEYGGRITHAEPEHSQHQPGDRWHAQQQGDQWS
ncbi:hypothetical protein D3C86_1383170 [compost metagenome]